MTSERAEDVQKYKEFVDTLYEVLRDRGPSRDLMRKAFDGDLQATVDLIKMMQERNKSLDLAIASGCMASILTSAEMRRIITNELREMKRRR